MVRSIVTKIQHAFTPILAILITAGICFLPGYAPILYFDDWYTFGQLYIFGGLRFVDWADRRPLLNSLEVILLDLFGLHLKPLYLIDIFVIFLCSVAFYFLARRLFPNHTFLALPAALLFLVFPVDMTRLWLSINYHWTNFLATLIAFYLLLDFAEKGSVWRLAVSLPLIAVPVIAYEGQMGIVVAWSLLLAVFTRRISYRRRLRLLYPVGIAALFFFWRTYFQPVVLNVHDPYMGFQSDQGFLSMLINRFMAIFPLYVNCWVLPFSSLLGVSARKMLIMMAGGIVCIGLLALWASKEHSSSDENTNGEPKDPAARSNPAISTTDRLAWVEKKRESLQLLAPFGAGIVMLLAGYFPGLIIVTPTLEWFGSRGNMFAIFGAALALTSLIALIGLWVAQNHWQMRLIAIAAMIPFLLMGATEQIWMQNEARLAWADQTHFWRALFQTIPNLQDNSTLVIAMPHDDLSRPFQRLPFTAQWEVTAALDVLYNNPTLRAIPYTPNHVESGGYGKLSPEGVQNFNYGLTPYDKVVLVYFVQGSHEVKLVRNINADIPYLGFQVKGYAPEKYILPDPPKSTPYRGLVLP